MKFSLFCFYIDRTCFDLLGFLGICSIFGRLQLYTAVHYSPYLT